MASHCGRKRGQSFAAEVSRSAQAKEQAGQKRQAGLLKGVD